MKLNAFRTSSLFEQPLSKKIPGSLEILEKSAVYRCDITDANGCMLSVTQSQKFVGHSVVLHFYIFSAIPRTKTSRISNPIQPLDLKYYSEACHRTSVHQTSMWEVTQTQCLPNVCKNSCHASVVNINLRVF